MSPLLELRQSIYAGLGYGATKLRRAGIGQPNTHALTYPTSELLPESTFQTDLRLHEPCALGEHIRSRIGNVQPAVGMATLESAHVNTEHGWVSVRETIYENLNRAIAFRGYGSPAFRTNWNKPIIKLHAPHLLLANHHSGNYYHWLIEALPRLLLYIEQTGLLPHILTPARTTFQRDFLRLFKGKLFADFTPLANDSLYECTNLTVITLPIVPGNPSPVILSLLRRNLLTVLPEHPPIKYSENILISRANSNYRKILNEKALLRELNPQSFEQIFLEKLPLDEQILLFNNAKTIIAPHGAGLANLVFCRDNTVVIELFSRNYINTCYASFAAVTKLAYFPIACNAVPSGFSSLLRKGRYNCMISDESIKKMAQVVTRIE